MTYRLNDPIVIVGPARSGTTVIGELIGRHPDVAYWVEPKYVWQYRAATAQDDEREREEATPDVCRYIRRRFEAFARARGCARFAEKTPSNCFRLSFVDAVLPDARYVSVVRDGRDVVLSAVRKWTTRPASDAVWRRLTSFEVPLLDVPSYLLQAVRGLVKNPWTSPRWPLWGPRYPGIRSDVETRSILEVCALQWRYSVEALAAGLATIPQGRVVSIRYEDLVSNPGDAMAQAMHRLGLRADRETIDMAETSVNRDGVGRWRDHPAREIESIYDILAPALRSLGYE